MTTPRRGRFPMDGKTSLATLLTMGALVVAALAVALAAGRDAPPSSVPSIENRGPQGLAALFLWLSSASLTTRATAPLTELPEGVASVVLAAPSEPVSNEEVDSLRRFVEYGGTLVYLAPRHLPQSALDDWLQLRPGPALPSAPLDTPTGVDSFGATATVRFQAGLTQGVSALRLLADTSITLEGDDAVPVTSSKALWFKRVGRGEVWVSAGADLAENAHLELEDNALFWANLASRGPIAFDEHHHQGRASAPTPLHLEATLAQLALCALVFAFAGGSRLGPPRDAPATNHRSALEYVEAMANLTWRAHLEEELVEALREGGRQLLQRRTGISTSLRWADAAVALECTDREAARLFTTLGKAEAFGPASVALAHFERRLLGLEGDA